MSNYLLLLTMNRIFYPPNGPGAITPDPYHRGFYMNPPETDPGNDMNWYHHIISHKLIEVTDDDATLDAAAQAFDVTPQMLAEPVEINGHSIAAGTPITIERMTLVSDGNGNHYYLSHLWSYDPTNPSAPTVPYAGPDAESWQMLMLPKDGAPLPDFSNPLLHMKTVPNFVDEGTYETPASVSYFTLDSSSEGTVCFAAGTQIDTPTGPRAIETLVPGDLVRTMDAGFQPVRWVGGAHLDARRLDLSPNLRPIRIERHALGRDQPSATLVVSPQHRVMVRSRIAQRMFGCDEVLIAAKHLVGLEGISVMNPAEGVGYWHLLLDDHHLVCSAGAWTESLYTGAQALKSVTPAARRELLALFPQLFADDYTPPTGARLFATGRQSRKLAERHGRNLKPLIEA